VNSEQVVLSLLRKLESDFAVLTSAGSSFHHYSARTEKSWDLEERCLAVLSEGGTVVFIYLPRNYVERNTNNCQIV